MTRHAPAVTAGGGASAGGPPPADRDLPAGDPTATASAPPAGVGSGTAAGGARRGGSLRGAVPLAAAGLLANVANLGVTLVIARQMSTRSYGAVAQLIAVFFVVSMPGSALLVGVVRRVTIWQHTGRPDLLDGWVRRIRRAGVATVLVVAVLAVAGRGAVAHELSLPGPGGIAEIIIAGAAWCLLCVDRGLLQCARQYGALAANLLVDAGVKTAVTIGLVLGGLAEAGAAMGVLCGVCAALLHTRRALARHPQALGMPRPDLPDSPGAPGTPALASPTPAVAERTSPELACPELACPDGITPGGTSFAAVSVPVAGESTPDTGRAPAAGVASRRLAVEVGAALVALGLLAVLQNVDVLMQGRLAPGRSGSYAAVSVASKVLVLAAVVLAGFLLPETADRRHLGQHALHQLGATIAILLVPAAGLLTAALVAPDTLLALAFGSRFTDASGALFPLAAAMTCLGATVLFTHYLLALGERGVLLALALAAAVTVPLLWWADGDPAATARADLACQAVLAVVTGLSVLAAARRTAREATGRPAGRMVQA
ncbi:hypothetical protein MXD61_07365 [Frankia sp. AgPm24]|uniref:hypothetical protein n=1 Tax=Frankia sp. AgPm24 TaxID=631128 RepID=UPI00201002F3|nr:hypothetical protein [Frankia sp. AgPm24]MCK9921708.1 hypothetical protein [Frankia sp. AgPm24]